MKIRYIGEIQSVIENLRNLGAAISFPSTNYCSGIIITDNILAESLVSIRNNYSGPIIVKGYPNNYYTNINALVLDEDGIKEFYEIHNIKTLQECKNKLKELKIHYLVVALTKKQIEQHVKFNIPKAKIKDVKITNKQVATAKDNLTALIGYIYIKEGTLSSEAINRANIGAALSVIGLADENLKDYYLDIKFKK